eukprot:3158566-Amphidinium_carterae.1
MDTTMRPDYTEDAIIGRAIIDQYFSKARLNAKQAGHHLWVDKQEVHTPPDMQVGDPSGTHAEGESRQDPPSGTHAEGGIPSQNENMRQGADPSVRHAEGEAVQPPP